MTNVPQAPTRVDAALDPKLALEELRVLLVETEGLASATAEIASTLPCDRATERVQALIDATERSAQIALHAAEQAIARLSTGG